jgi:lipopolysaccharide transport system permease protein
MTSETGTQPFKRITPPKGWLRIDWQELWRYRELLYFLSWRDVAIRYKQAVFGILWAFIQPFTNLIVCSLIFGRLAKIDSEGYPYPVFFYAAFLPWQFFSASLTQASGSVIGSSGLVTKIYFPRLIIPIASIGAALLDFAISFIILFGLMIYYGIMPTPAMMMIIPLTILTIFAALGAGILLSALSVSYRDFRFVVPFLLQIWMFLTPVIYPSRVFGAQWHWLISLNPMTGIVEAYRASILGRSFDFGTLSMSAIVSIIILGFAIYHFRRAESRFADII